MTKSKPKRTPGKPATSEAAHPSSPVCYADEMDPHYAGYLASAEIAALLKGLIADERGIMGKLDAALPRVKDDRIHAALKGMRRVHEVAAARSAALLREIPQ